MSAPLKINLLKKDNNITYILFKFIFITGDAIEHFKRFY